MSVFFKEILPGNPVQAGDVEVLLDPLNLTIRPEESSEYQLLLAAVHDCADRVSNLPDYQPVPDIERFPRQNIHLPEEHEQSYGHAWAHRFIIEGDQSSRSALAGKAVCLKDCIAVAGVPQFFGSDAFPAWTPSTDATVVTRALEAGAVITGTATCENFCNSTSSFTSAQGTIDNPRKAGYSAGGSTSGGAALVTGRLADIAIGTDQGGSIRVPASLCGCVGFKPTHGLVPYTGITSGDQIDDHAGPLARTVDEVAACLDVIAGYDGIDDRSLGAPSPGSFNYLDSLAGASVKGLRIGVLKEGYDNDLVQPGVKQTFFNIINRLKSLGASVSEVSIPLHKEGPSIWTIQQRISGSAGILGQANGRRGLYLTEFEHARLPWTSSGFEKLFPSTKNTVINGIYLSRNFPGLYAKTVNIGRQIRDAYEAKFKEYDVIIMPTTPFVAPRHGSRESVLKSFEPSIGMTNNTAIFNVTGNPALSLPVGWSKAVDDESVSLPVGLQIVGGLWQEKKVLNVAKALESSFDWEQEGKSTAEETEDVLNERLAEHEGDVPSPEPAQGNVTVVQQRNDSIADPDLAAAVSLSGLSVDPWFCARTQQPIQLPVAVPQTVDEQVQHPASADDGQFVPNFLSPQMLDSGVDFDTHFREFTSFLDGVGLSAEWSPFFGDPDRHEEPIDPRLTQDSNEETSPRQGAPTRAGTPFSSWLPSAPTGNRISNYVSDTDNPRAIDPETRPFKVTEEQRSKLKASILDHSHLLDPSFCVPSRHALTRYVTSFFGGFHTHMPFIHIPTWQINDHSPELIFGIAAIGAQYCFESRASERLFFAGKALLMERLRNGSDSFGLSTLPIPHVTSQSGRRADTEADSAVETIRALITLMGFATWEPKAPMVQESFVLQGILTQVLRNSGLEDVDEPASPTPSDQPTDGNSLWHEWKTWIKQESNRRSKLIGFSFLHTHSIAYNIYPTLRSNEIGLRLPCSTKEWKAPTPALWRAATKEIQEPQLFFREALSLLLKNKNDTAPLLPIPTPLGNYVLLHGLLQRIHIVRDLSLPVTSSSAVLPSEEVEKLERGLRSWTSCWQQAPESTLDPNNENGPIPFTSSSLLSLAYVRIYLHLGPYRQLETRDPQRIANAIASSPDIERSDGVIAALLYSAHMIGIPVRLGVDRVARSQAFFWSVRHSLSGLDCAVLLSKWLSKLGETIAEHPLSDSEDRILHWVRCIVEEAYTVVDFDQGVDTDNPSLLDFRDPSNLSLAVLKIWAHFFKSNTQWPFINIIGVGLEKYREILIHKNFG
ncbi:hypothetical protein FPRO05_11139 [Fusarium proliferatum]|uniref:Amidase domain-containing protein n=1 Tax=Gibberella intermedia TaxID=948311 RepID=A0A365NBF1_GIBIN|nr:hypothetical protein FPRO05_11139 [Fusarium proliferatum]